MSVCGVKMRDGTCQLDEGHKAKRHTTVAFECDGCGKRRAGYPTAQHSVVLGDGSVDDTFNFCFLCTIFLCTQQDLT